MREQAKRKQHFRQGRRGRLVRVVEGTHRQIPVFWVEYRKQDGKRTARPFPRTRTGKSEAMEFARGVVEQQAQPTPETPQQITVADLGKRWMEAAFPAFRPNTIRMARDAWAPFEAFVGPHTVAEDVGRDSMAAFRAELDRRGWAVTTIRTTLGWIRQVYGWGEDGELISRNRVSRYVYKVAKDKRPESPAEFRMEEFSAILGALRLDFSNQWRAHVALGVCGYQGARSWSVLHLQWDDLAFDLGVITWRAAWDKMGNEWEQPMRAPTRALLAVALKWRETNGYSGPWVFYPASKVNKQPIYTQQSLLSALGAAEKRAGIVHQTHRGAHGLRRMLAGEVNAMSGDAKLALDAIGDRDIRQAQRYLKRRDDRVRIAFDALDARMVAE